MVTEVLAICGFFPTVAVTETSSRPPRTELNAGVKPPPTLVSTIAGWLVVRAGPWGHVAALKLRLARQLKLVVGVGSGVTPVTRALKLIVGIFASCVIATTLPGLGVTLAPGALALRFRARAKSVPS
jgi:hypothetical protein